MRLIDADAIYSEMKDYYFTHRDGHDASWEGGFGKCMNMIPKAPTSDLQPRKGKWTRHFDGNEWYWYCSSCKEQWYEEDLWMGGNSFPNFCPHCGADMRGDNNDS